MQVCYKCLTILEVVSRFELVLRFAIGPRPGADQHVPNHVGKWKRPHSRETEARA